MNPKSFEKLLNKRKYQVFLFSCPVSFPANFGFHYWFVINKKGKISRWEVLYKKKMSKPSWGYLHLNHLPPAKGLRFFIFSKSFYWKSKLQGFIEGNKKSLAKKMINFIEKTPKYYQHNHKYSLLLGPNSNTFIQHIVDKFPKSEFKLLWRAFGKNYKH